MHANARLTPTGRLTMVLRIESGRAVAHMAAEMGISRPTAYKWWHRWNDEGELGLVERPSRPHGFPHGTSPAVEAQIEELRRTLKLGPARIGYRLGVPTSTVHWVLTRLGITRLSWMDRPTGRVIRRNERGRPGELVHVDIKKLGRIPDGGGWRVLGKAHGNRHNDGHGSTRTGYGFIHSAVDDHSRLDYSEILGDERKETAAGFWLRAQAWFSELGVEVEEVLTDNGSCYRSRMFDQALGTRSMKPQFKGVVTVSRPVGGILYVPCGTWWPSI